MNNDNKKQTAAVYVRVSTEEQAKEGYSIQAQTDILTQYCELYNINIYKVYKDLGLSGKNINGRPALNELLNDSSENRFNYVIVWKISRLSRNLKDLLYLVDKLESNNTSFISYSEKFDTSTPIGRMTLQILGSIAEFERNTIIENVKIGLDQRAKEGKWTGNHVYGYDNIDKKLVVNRKESEIVKRIYSLYNDENIGFRKIAFILNNEGIKTKRNTLFGSDYIFRILSNPLYKGYVRHHIKSDKEYSEVKGIHEPIISEETFNLVQEKIKTRSKTLSRSINGFFLTGLLKCRQCGSNLISSYGQDKGRKYRYYKCSKYHRQGPNACSPNTINADKIESAVLERLKGIFINPLVINSVIEEAGNMLKTDFLPTDYVNERFNNELCRLSNLRDKYIKLFECDKITAENLTGRLIELKEQICDLNRKMTMFEAESEVKDIPISDEEIINYLKNITHIFKHIAAEDKRKLLHDLIQSINLDENKNLHSIELKFPLE